MDAFGNVFPKFLNIAVQRIFRKQKNRLYFWIIIRHAMPIKVACANRI